MHGHTRHQVTVGSACTAWLALVSGLGLDFYQAHWYDSVEKRSPLARPVASLSLDRPLILGEYPTKGSARSAEAILATAIDCGYSGALAWSLLAGDDASEAAVCERLVSRGAREAHGGLAGSPRDTGSG